MTGLNEQDRERYQRHLCIPEIGVDGQEKLKNGSVLIIGAGGLGSASALYLAAAGIGKIGIIDSDRVNLSNLQRQVLHDTHSINKPKVESAAQRLRALNPEILISGYDTRFDEKCAKELVPDYQIIVDATDNFDTRYLANSICVRFGKPFVYGAVFQWFGQMSVFSAASGPCFRCVFRSLPNDLKKNDNQVIGVVSPVPGVIGTLQAIEVIKLILNAGTQSIGRLLLFDGLNMSFQEISIRKDPSCPVCGKG